MFKLLAIEFCDNLTVFRHFHIKYYSLHSRCGSIRILAAVHIQFGFLVVHGNDAVDVCVEFCFTFLRRSEGRTTEARSYTVQFSFIQRQFTLPVYILFFAVPTEIHLHFATYRISIIDRGNGLKQVNTQKLFTRFYQGTGEQSGTGIGLSYSRILVELHGGSIGARDNQEAGATFFFELPLRQQSEEIVCQPKAYLNELMNDDSKEQLPEENTFDTSPYSILVVDDNPDLTDFLKKSLGEYFKRVVIASDGVEALQLTRNHAPDIIVSDVMMPRMNGYELCKNIKEDITISHIPIILLTARDDKQSQLSGYKNGADAYLTKPFEIEMLMEIIRNRLKNRESIKKRYLNTGLVPAPEESTFSQADETFLLKLNKIIQEHLDSSNLDVTFICKEIGMSRASLYNKLKALTDMGANDYINKFRMEKAITLITSTDMSFTEIAEKVGFTTSRYFSTAFKQYTGETPTQYKEKRKQERKKE